MIPKNYVVIFEDGTKSEEFAYSPAEACEQAIVILGQHSKEGAEIPKIISIRPADEIGLQKIQTEALTAYFKNVREQLKEFRV